MRALHLVYVLADLMATKLGILLSILLLIPESVSLLIVLMPY